MLLALVLPIRSISEIAIHVLLMYGVGTAVCLVCAWPSLVSESLIVWGGVCDRGHSRNCDSMIRCSDYVSQPSL